MSSDLNPRDQAIQLHKEELLAKWAKTARGAILENNRRKVFDQLQQDGLVELLSSNLNRLKFYRTKGETEEEHVMRAVRMARHNPQIGLAVQSAANQKELT